MCVVQVNQLGEALAKPAPNPVPYREGRFLVRLVAMAEWEPARRILDPAFDVVRPWTLGRAVDFAFGAGGRGAGLYDPPNAEETRRGAVGVRPGEPLRRGYGVTS
ncbi:hypothetical protein ACFU53_25740 [Streptomyces sp. NPDC057474]|uniref:hypothetical protein n=1 Tax=Streptomyces sp. NPDC057474 TaxID=3346144 RepID=UPI0036C67245